MKIDFVEEIRLEKLYYDVIHDIDPNPNIAEDYYEVEDDIIGHLDYNEEVSDDDDRI